MWSESSSVNSANLVKKSATVPDIEFFPWIVLLAHPVQCESENITLSRALKFTFQRMKIFKRYFTLSRPNCVVSVNYH